MITYKGYRLAPTAHGVDLYKGKRFVTWALSAAQAMRLIDEMEEAEK
jgi:hypothetical protein